MDTGASETILDDRLIPRGHLRDLTHRSAPKIVEVAGAGQVQGTATGILHCTVQDNHGQQLPLRLKGLIVPGLGRNIYIAETRYAVYSSDSSPSSPPAAALLAARLRATRPGRPWP